jgi:glycosyltransferase involved in cell wall biosynthesis
MSILNVIFDKIFVINLKKDIYKKNNIIDKFINLNINFSFFDAVNGYETTEIIKAYNDYKNKPFDWIGSHKYERDRQKKMIPSLGAYGYLQTWINILNFAKEKCYKKILVFDDDIIFDNDFEIKLNKFFTNIECFKIVSLGVSQHIWKNIVINDNYYHPIEFTDGSFAIGIDETIYDELLQDCLKYNISFDSGPVRNIYIKYKNLCYISYPNLVIADLSSSDISNSRNMIKYSNKFKWYLENFNYIRNTNILVSIILTNFNSEKSIKLAIESILNQTYKTIELIIVDDGSTDNSLNIISNYENLFNVKVIKLYKNYGCYFAKNIGLLLSKGEYIGFQDSDDVSSCFRIEKQIKYLLENDNLDMVFCNIIKCDYIINNFDCSIKNERKSGYLGLISLLIRRSVLNKIGLYCDYYPHSMDQEFIDRYYYKKFNKLSDEHTHNLLNFNKIDSCFKLNEVLYICNPYTSKNISVNYSRGNKNYIRELYLEDIKNNKLINLINLNLINFVKENIGKIEDNHYLKYFVNNSDVKLDINKFISDNNYILIEEEIYNIKNNGKLLTTNLSVSKYYNNIKYFDINKSYKVKLEEETNKNLILKLFSEEKYKDTFNNLDKNFDLNDFTRINNITQIFSKNYTSCNENTLFDKIDLNKIKNHYGKKWLLIDKIELKLLYECLFCNIEDIVIVNYEVHKYLCDLKINHIFINNLIEKNIFNTKENINCNIFNKISKIYVLNLKRKLDKKKLITFKLNKLGIRNYEFYNGIDSLEDEKSKNAFSQYNNTITNDDYITKNTLFMNNINYFSILFSYINLINYILSIGYNDNEYIIIFEDDIIFNKNINKYKLHLNEEVIYLGVYKQLNFSNGQNNKLDNKEFTDLNTFGVIYRISFLKKFIKILKEDSRKPYNYLLWEFITKNNINNRIINPNLVITNFNQKSDIFNFNKSKLLENYDTIYLDLFYYNVYTKIYDNQINLRILNEFNLDNLNIKDISRIIEDKNKTFVFIITSYNNSHYIKKNLDSILNQNYKLWRIIYIDDNSSDNTYDLVNDYIKNNNLYLKCKLIRNNKCMNEGYNRFVSYNLVDDDEIVCFLYGDDWLYDNYVLDRLNAEYMDDILLTFGSYCEFKDGKNSKIRNAIDYSNDVKEKCRFRERGGWFGIPLRTGCGYLYKDIPENYLKDCDGNWFCCVSCTDIAEFLWAIEKVDNRYKAIKWVGYVYNLDGSKKFNLSDSEYKYRVKSSEKIFNYKKLNYDLNK